MRHLAAVVMFSIGCGASVSYTAAPGAPSRPPIAPDAVRVIELEAEAPDGVVGGAQDACALVASPPAHLLGTIEVGSHAMSGQSVRSDEREREARKVAAAHGGAVLGECAGRYYVLALDPGAAPPASAALLASVTEQIAARGYAAETTASLHDGTQRDWMRVQVVAGSCYALGFALDGTARWGLDGKRGLHVDARTGLAPASGVVAATPWPAAADQAHPFATARAGWQELGCAASDNGGFVSVEPSKPMMWGQGQLRMQLFRRPGTPDELAAAATYLRDRRNARANHQRAQQACAICAPQRCRPGFECGAYDACLAERDTSSAACR